MHDAPLEQLWLTQSSKSTEKFKRERANACDDRCWKLTARCRVYFLCAILTVFTMFSWESHGTVTWVSIDAVYAWCTIGAIVVDTVIQVYRKIQKGKSKCDDWCWKLTARCRVDFLCAILTVFTMFSWESHRTFTWVAIDVIYAWCAVGASVINAIVNI